VRQPTNPACFSCKQQAKKQDAGEPSPFLQSCRHALIERRRQRMMVRRLG
jgi:hypothetical protein